MKALLIKVSFILTTLALIIGCSNANSSKDLEYANIGTAGTGGAYYPIGISMAEVLTNDLDVDSSAEVTGGAEENIELVNNGEVELAITQSPIAIAGYEGEGQYDEKNDNIATLTNGLSRGVFHLVTSSDIDSVEELKGKKVVLGPQGGAGVMVMEDILSFYDMTLDDIDSTYVAYDEGISMLKDKNVDAVVVQSALPASAITELSATTSDFNILSFSEEEAEQLEEEYDYLNSMTIDADEYDTEEDVLTLYTTNMVIVRNDIDEDDVYNITKSLFENIEEIKESHPAAGELSLEKAAKEPPVPLHPGAEKYYKEKEVLE